MGGGNIRVRVPGFSRDHRRRLSAAGPTLGTVLVEIPPRCLGPSSEHHRLVGWQPCHCSSGRTGHRLHYCQDCRLLISSPVCMRKERTVRENGIGT